MTIDRNFWFSHKSEVIATILSDAAYNGDGWALVCIDTDRPESDVRLATMQIGPILAMLDVFFTQASSVGRMFLHARSATTRSVGIAYNHDFTDGNGTLIMHNGVIANGAMLAVDSFNLGMNIPVEDADYLLTQLRTTGETFANVFLIHPEQATYSVVRLTTGRLYSDGKGNYSTNSMAGIKSLVPEFTAEYNYLDGYVPKKFKESTSSDFYLGDWSDVFPLDQSVLDDDLIDYRAKWSK